MGSTEGDIREIKEKITSLEIHMVRGLSDLSDKTNDGFTEIKRWMMTGLIILIFMLIGIILGRGFDFGWLP